MMVLGSFLSIFRVFLSNLYHRIPSGPSYRDKNLQNRIFRIFGVLCYFTIALIIQAGHILYLVHMYIICIHRIGQEEAEILMSNVKGAFLLIRSLDHYHGCYQLSEA
jgi:hypothetical protein